jgi:tricorn protease
MFAESWRLERDYFYDRGMHGVDWPAVRKRFEPLLARVHDREELDDLIAQMVSELSALHIFVVSGACARDPTR